MAVCTVLAPGAPWPLPPAQKVKLPPVIKPRKKKTTIFKEYISANPGSYPIQVSTAMRIDYRATQRTLRQMAEKGALCCKDSAYYPT